MTALVTTKTDPIGLADAITPPPTRYVGASIFNFWNDTPTRISEAAAAGLNVVRIVDWLTSNKNVTDTSTDPTAWALVDAAIAAASNAGLRVILDLSTYRNWLAKHTNTNPYTAGWSTFVSFVAARVNTVSGIQYAKDQTILQVSIAGEPAPAGETDGSAVLMPITSGQLVSFYGTVSALVAAAFPAALISSGGLLHYRAGSVGDTAWVDWQGIFQAVKTAAGSRSRAALHVYSGVDFGGSPGSGDEAQVPTVAAYCATNAIAWVVEEFGLEQDGGQGAWVANDTLRASRFRNVLALAFNNGATAVLYWNGGTELYFDPADVNGSAPVNLVGGAIVAWTPGTYGTFDARSNGGQNWYSLIGANTTTPNDAHSASWGKLKVVTDDVGSHTPVTYAAVQAFCRAVLQAPRAVITRAVGKNATTVAQLTGENDYIDETGVQYVDELGVPYAIGN